MKKISRILKIFHILWFYGLFDLLKKALKPSILSVCIYPLTIFNPSRNRPRAERLRLALQALGPVFIKFGQVLSTRRDLLPEDISDELAKLQDQVIPFSSEESAKIVEKALGKTLAEVFTSFDKDPIASASIAQVHFGILKGDAKNPELAGKAVAVKVLRPNILKVIESDLALMHSIARLIEKFSYDGKRLKPREVVEGFDMTIHDELDLLREAANCSQLRRNFEGSTKIMIPEVHWDYCHPNVMVMERMYGISIAKLDDLKAAGVDLRLLAVDGVEVFFTQAFAHGFFHADMHPGNIMVSTAPETFGRLISLDFGIVGTLSEVDKNYLVQNFLAFFNRDYHRVAALHIESGWVPEETKVEELEGAVRAVCEPYFDRPLKDISLGLVLLRLFQTSRRFKVEIQPQLTLLQKTLLNVEGLGRQLDPDLDLWKTVKPIMQDWMNEQIGFKGFFHKMQKEAPHWAQTIPTIPRLITTLLEKNVNTKQEQQLDDLIHQLKMSKNTNLSWKLISIFLIGFCTGGFTLLLLIN